MESQNLSAEHRFQKEKTLIMAERHAILDARTPEEAKALGRTVTLRPDRDDIKLDTMRTVAAAKFTEVRNPGFARRLANTGTAVLIETGDPFWGVDKQTGEGENHLGLILMELRAQLLTELPELSADEIAEMIAAQAALAPAPALPVLDQAILAALTVKGFTRQSVELRAAAIADSIRGRWDEIVAEVVPAAVAAQPKSPVEEPVAEPESVLSEPIAEPGAVEVPSVSSEEELEPEAALVEPVGEPDKGPAPAELEAPTTEIFDGITVETATGEVIEPEPGEPAAPVPFVPEPHRILVATDGSAAPTNPGPAGWGWYVSETCWAAGAARQSTNNRAELAAMYNLFLATADTNPPLHFLCNSKYVIGAMNGNRANVNADLVEKLRAVSAGRDFTLEWVKGHNGHPLNEGADEKCAGASAAVRAGQIIPTGPGWTIVFLRAGTCRSATAGLFWLSPHTPAADAWVGKPAPAATTVVVECAVVFPSWACRLPWSSYALVAITPFAYAGNVSAAWDSRLGCQATMITPFATASAMACRSPDDVSSPIWEMEIIRLPSLIAFRFAMPVGE